MDNGLAQKPDIFEYSNYRDFVKNLIEHYQESDPKFSYRRLCFKAKIKSPNYIQLILQGKRNLTISTSEKIAQYFNLSEPEIKFLKGLIIEEKAECVEEHELANSLKYRAKAEAKPRQEKAKTDQFFRKWYYLAVRELTLQPNFKADGHWISEQLNHSITPEDAINAFHYLLEGKFIEEDGNTYKCLVPAIDLNGDPSEGLVNDFYRENFQYWIDSLKHMKRKECFLEIFFMNLNDDTVKKIKDLLMSVSDEIDGVAPSPEEEPSPRMYQLGVVFFPSQPR